MQSELVRRTIRISVFAVMFGVTVLPPVQAQQHEVGHWLGLYSIGLVSGQTFRVSVPNLPDPDLPGPSPGPLRVAVRAFDRDGRSLADAELEVPLGQTRFFDLDRDAIPLDGEDRTGRVQVAVQLFFTGKLKVSCNELPSVGGGEIVDKGTGKTASIAIPNLIEIRKGGREG